MLGNANNRIASLDGLRAVAILMVIFSHAAYTCHFPAVAPHIFYFFNGELGVRIFFVISGFIITHLLLREENKGGEFSIKYFYVRRAIRILPVYFTFLLVVYLIDRWLMVGIATNEFIAAASFTTGWWNDSTWLLGHTWSLSVEEQFYLLWPLLLFLIKSKRLRCIATILLILFFPVMRTIVYLSTLRDRMPYLFITQGDAILMGCLLALFLYYEGERAKKWFISYVFLGRIAGVICIAALNMLSGQRMAGWVTVPLLVSVQSMVIAWMIASFIFNKDSGYSFLNSKVLVFLGTISYSWYLWQQVFLFACGRFFKGITFEFPGNLLCSFVIAVISYFLIEKTFLKLRNQWIKA